MAEGNKAMKVKYNNDTYKGGNPVCVEEILKISEASKKKL